MKAATEKTLLRQIIKEEVKRNLLYEGLMFSYSPSFIFSHLKFIGYSQVSFTKEKLFLISFFLDENNLKRYEKLNDFMQNVCGWIHSATLAGKQTVMKKNDFLEVKEGIAILQYEAKFNIKVDKLPPKIYHLTFGNKLEKIRKDGLTPKTSTVFFNFNDRIYFSKKEESLKNLTIQKHNITKKNNFIILEIDTSSLQHGIRFFEDPLFINGMYTLENIPPISIKPIKRLIVQKDNTINVEAL